jgi:hypothetical protein
MYPVGWQIYAWQEKASGRTLFFPKNNCWFVGKK